MNRFIEFDLVQKQLTPIAGYWAYPLVSLEQALAPFSSKINQLGRSIREAKKHCHFPSEHGLTRDESAAVFLYTMEAGEYSFYRILNQILRDEDRNKATEWFHYLKLFDTALEKLPTAKGCIWRGVSGDLSQFYHENDSLTWWSITSCSLSAKEAEKFLNPEENSTLFMIEAANGKNVSGYTVFSNEKEVVLGIGTQFRVKSNALKHGKLHVVHLAEVDSTTDEEVSTAIAVVHLSPKPSRASARSIPNIPVNARWAQNGLTVAGGNGDGNATNQLSHAEGLFVDDNQTMVIADHLNHRIVQWKMGDVNGKVIAADHGNGNQSIEFNTPTDVLVDKQTDSLITCDAWNRRVVQWSRRNGITQGEILFDNILGYGLAMDDQGYLYISDREKHEVRRYRMGDKIGTLVAGGHGKGAGLNEFNCPKYIFVDREQAVYVSDCYNHRVMKWNKGATEGIVIAGGNGCGGGMTQLSNPQGLFVDTMGTLYVADKENHRVMRWLKGAKHGTVIVGGNGYGKEANQFRFLRGLSFDRHGNLYVVDRDNSRVQCFPIE